jgi:hypothetical protein
MAARRSPPLVDRFVDPLTALAASGTVAVLVNTDGGREADAGGALRHMAKTTGGLYFEGRDPKDLEKRIAGSTTAYYEASFRPTASLLQTSRAELRSSSIGRGSGRGRPPPSRRGTPIRP